MDLMKFCIFEAADLLTGTPQDELTVNEKLCINFECWKLKWLLLSKKFCSLFLVFTLFLPLPLFSPFLPSFSLLLLVSCSSNAMSNNWLRIDYCHSRVFRNVSFNIVTRDALIIRVVICISQYLAFLVNWLLVQLVSPTHICYGLTHAQFHFQFTVLKITLLHLCILLWVESCR